MLLNGVTTFCDGYFFEGEAARAALEAGIRAVLGQGVLDFPTPDQPDPARARESVEAFLEAFPTGAGGRLRPSLFCHSPYTCGPDTLRWVKAVCREREILFQIHLSETAPEVEALTRERGERPVAYLDRLGILDEKTLCAHAVWVDSAEIELLAARGATISHNAESNMKLASGVADVPRFLEAGCRVGLGTDGCASNNDLDLFSEMGRVARLHKVFRQDPVVSSAEQVLRMATRDGAETLGWGAALGRLEAGAKADLAAVDLNQPHLTPLFDPISHIVYAMRGSDVRHVWVDGRLVVESGRVLTVSVADVLREAKRLAGKVKAALK
jgi:5-methylthioadenosine/S-adenosylhomocysteine deaminase